MPNTRSPSATPCRSTRRGSRVRHQAGGLGARDNHESGLQRVRSAARHATEIGIDSSGSEAYTAAWRVENASWPAGRAQPVSPACSEVTFFLPAMQAPGRVRKGGRHGASPSSTSEPPAPGVQFPRPTGSGCAGTNSGTIITIEGRSIMGAAVMHEGLGVRHVERP
jgi:hypothetical protein